MIPDLSMRQLLSVWHELQAARQGSNGYGGHTAEIYAFRLTQLSPTALLASGESELGRQAREKMAQLAVDNLIAVLRLFQEFYPDTVVWVDDVRFTGNNIAPNDHRFHVLIRPKSDL